MSIIYRHSNQWNTGKSFHISHFALNISHFVFHILYLTSHISHFAFCISHFAFVFHMFTFRILFFTSSILYFEFHIFYFLFHMSHFVFQMSHCHISHFECCISYLTFLASHFKCTIFVDLDWRAVFDQACSCRKKHKNDLFLKKLLCCVGGQDTLGQLSTWFPLPFSNIPLFRQAQITASCRWTGYHRMNVFSRHSFLAATRRRAVKLETSGITTEKE